jgi:hypothetical protein
MKRYFSLFAFFILLIFQSQKSIAQKNITDSISFAMIGASGQYQLPGGDLADRFGYNFNVGGFFNWKLKNNWLFGVDGDFIFGNQLKEDGILDNLSTSDGNIISGDGTYAIIHLYERGLMFSAKAGKVLHFFGANPNSGLLVTAGAGLLQHKIRIDVKDNTVEELSPEYKKGYDRLTNGLSLTEFVGYMHCGNNRLINFFAGFEFTQAFTQNRRDFNFDTMTKDNTKRLDMLMGIKAGWFFPLYKHAVNQYYYN